MLIRPTEFPRLAGAVGGAALLAAALGVGVSPASAAPTWLDREVVSTPAQSAVDTVSPAVSAGGDLAVLHTRGVPVGQPESTATLAELRVRPFGAAWSPAQSFTANGRASTASLGIADDGRALGFWSGGTGNLGLFASTRAPGQLFADPVKDSTKTVSTSPFPASAINRAGVGVTAWVEGTNLTTSQRVVARVRSASGELGPEQRLSRDSDGTYDPIMEETEPGAKPEKGAFAAVGPNGSVFVAWSQTDKKAHSGTRAYVAVQRPGQASFDTPALLTDLPTTGGSPTERVRAIAVGADGTVAVSLVGSGGAMLVARRAPGATTFEAPVQVNGTLSGGFGSQGTGASIAVDGSGRITAAFDTGGTTTAGNVYVTRQATAGGAFPEATAVPAPTGTYPRGAAVSVSPAGDAIVAWADATINAVATRHARIVAVTRRGPTGALSAPQLLDERDYTGDIPLSSPKIATGPDGDALVGWGWNAGTPAAPSWEARLAALDREGPVVADAGDEATAGTTVALRAEAKDRLSSVAEVRWAFGDGTTAVGANQSHVYRQPGSFRAKITAVDANGNERTTTRTVTVSAPTVPGAPTWLAPQILSTPAPSNVDNVSPAVSVGGDVGVLYTRGTPDAGEDSSSSQAEATLRPLGGEWSRPQTFGPTNGAASAASLTIGDDGRAFGVWSGGTNNLGIFGVGRAAGERLFGDAAAVSTAAVSNSPIPHSAANADGVTAVAWVEGGPTSARVVNVRVRDRAAADFGAEIKLKPATADAPAGSEPDRGPRVAVAPDGTVTVAWSEIEKRSGALPRAYVAVRRPGQAGFDATKLITDVPPATNAREAVREIAVGADGTVAVGLIGDGGAMSVARRAPGQTAFAAPVKISGTLSGGFGSQATGAALAVDGSGRVTAVFDTGGVSSEGNVYLAQQDEPGGAFSAPTALLAPAQTYPRSPVVAVSPKGDAVIAWVEGTITSAPQRHVSVVAVTRQGATGTLSAPRVLDERDYGGTMLIPASRPGVSIGRDGDALVGWGWDTGTNGNGSWTARSAALDAEGPIVRDEAVAATAGTAVTLRAAATDRFSKVAEVRWAFGDGATATGQDVEHVYAEPGVYAAKLTAVDEHGHERTATRTVTVTAAEKPDPGPGTGTTPTTPNPGDTPIVPNPPAPGPGTVPTPAPAPNPDPKPTASAPKVSGVRIAGRTVSLRTTAAGRLRVELQRRTVTRVRKGGKTVRRTVYRRVQRLTVRATKAGTLRVKVRKLPAGSYRVRVTPLGTTGAKTTTTSVRVSR